MPWSNARYSLCCFIWMHYLTFNVRYITNMFYKSNSYWDTFTLFLLFTYISSLFLDLELVTGLERAPVLGLNQTEGFLPWQVYPVVKVATPEHIVVGPYCPSLYLINDRICYQNIFIVFIFQYQILLRY